MAAEEAMSWLREVRGQLYRSNPHESGNEAWVAVVRTPRAGARNGKLIIALGGSMEEAAASAHGQWQKIWQSLSSAH